MHLLNPKELDSYNQMPSKPTPRPDLATHVRTLYYDIHYIIRTRETAMTTPSCRFDKRSPQNAKRLALISDSN